MNVTWYAHEDLEDNLQIAKSVLILQLRDEGHLAEEVVAEYLMNRALIVKKPSFFNNIWKNIARDKDGKENMRIILVKQVNLKDREIAAAEDKASVQEEETNEETEEA